MNNLKVDPSRRIRLKNDRRVWMLILPTISRENSLRFQVPFFKIFNNRWWKRARFDINKNSNFGKYNARYHCNSNKDEQEIIYRQFCWNVRGQEAIYQEIPPRNSEEHVFVCYSHSKRQTRQHRTKCVGWGVWWMTNSLESHRFICTTKWQIAAFTGAWIQQMDRRTEKDECESSLSGKNVIESNGLSLKPETMGRRGRFHRFQVEIRNYEGCSTPDGDSEMRQCWLWNIRRHWSLFIDRLLDVIRTVSRRNAI